MASSKDDSKSISRQKQEGQVYNISETESECGNNRRGWKKGLESEHGVTVFLKF